jgi:hypothetical protein
VRSICLYTAVATIVVLSSCAGAASSPDTPGGTVGLVAPDVSGAGPTAGDMSSIASPNGSAPAGTDSQLLTLVALQSYAASDEELIWTVTQHLLQVCMSTRGFDYQAIPSEDVEGNRKMASKVDALDLSIAVSAGYHPDAIRLDGNVQMALDAYNTAGDANSTSAAAHNGFVEALEGPEGGAGCLKEAYDRLYGDRRPLPELFASEVAPAVVDIETEVAADSVEIAAVAAWSECMHSAGYDYRDPQEPRRAYSSSPQVTPPEIATATQDSKCRGQVDLLHIHQQVEALKLQSWLDAHPGLLEQLESAREEDVSTAKSLQGGV